MSRPSSGDAEVLMQVLGKVNKLNLFPHIQFRGIMPIFDGENIMGDDGITIDSNGEAVRLLRQALPGAVISAGKIELIVSEWALNKLKERERKKLDKLFEAGGAVPWSVVKADLEKLNA